MKEYVIAEKSELTAIADAIRTKTGGTKELSIFDMATEIAGLSSTETLISYVVGIPVEFTIPSAAWDGTHCSVKAEGYQVGSYGLYIGLPIDDNTVNTRRVIAAALTLPNYTFTAANTENNTPAYTTLTISTVEAPTEDIKIAVFGLEEVTA